MNLNTALEQFIQNRITRRCGKPAISAYRSHLNTFCAFLTDRGISEANQIGDSQLSDYFRTLQTRNQFRRSGKLSPITIQKHVAAMRTFLKWLFTTHIISSDLTPSLPPFKPGRRLPKALSPLQVNHLLSQNLSPRDKALLYLLLDSGLRIAEATHLQRTDLDLSRGTAFISHAKGDKQRLVLFSPNTSQAIQDYLSSRNDTSLALFVDKNAQPLTTYGTYKIIKRIGQAAGEHVSPHMLRHTFATTYLDNGGSLPDAQLLLGHSNIQTTMIYVHVAIEKLRQKHIILSPLTSLLPK